MPEINPITIVIPVYNREMTLPATLRSIEMQRVQPAAVVLVDNNSTDGSAEIISRWCAEGENRLSTHCPKPGACAARNCGLALVETEFVMFFDSDDIMLPDHVERFTEAITAHPDTLIFTRDSTMELSDGSMRRVRYGHGDPLFHHILRGYLATQRFVACTQLVRECGGWNETVRAWDDFELGARLLLAAEGRVAHIPGSSVTTTFQEVSITGRYFAEKAGQWEHSLDTIFDTLSGNAHAREWVNARRAILAAAYHRESLSAPPELRSRAASARDALLEQLFAATSRPRRMRFIYAYSCRIPRLAWIWAKGL